MYFWFPIMASCLKWEWHEYVFFLILIHIFSIHLSSRCVSCILTLQGDKLRKRERWEIWLLPKQGYSAGNSSGSLSPVTSNIDSLASQFQSVGLEGAGYHASQGMPGEALLTRSATSVSLGYQAPPLGGLYSNGSGPLFGQKSARSLLRSDTFWGFTQERLQRHAEFSLVTARVPHLLGWGVRTKIQLIWKKTTKKRK
jgi:hypothetical protein